MKDKYIEDNDCDLDEENPKLLNINNDIDENDLENFEDFEDFYSLKRFEDENGDPVDLEF
jgi:hypothetical protein